MGGSGYPEAAAVPVRERDGKRHVDLTVSMSPTLCSVTIAPWVPILLYGSPSLSHSFWHSLSQGPCPSSPGFCSSSFLGVSFPLTLSVCPAPKSLSLPLGQCPPPSFLAFPLWASVPRCLGFCPLSWGLCSPFCVPLCPSSGTVSLLSQSLSFSGSLSHSPAPPFAPPPALRVSGMPRPKLDGGSGGSGLSRADLESGLVEGMWGAG